MLELLFIRIPVLFCFASTYDYPYPLLSSSNAIKSHAVQESVGWNLMHINVQNHDWKFKMSVLLASEFIGNAYRIVT